MGPQTALVRRRLDDAVLHIRMCDVPRRNALSAQMASELNAAVHDTDGVVSIVLSAEGRHFCAGGDHDEVNRLTQDQMDRYRGDLATLFRRLADSPSPVVVAVQGAAIGGGTEIAVRADFVVADESAIFSLPQVPMGIAVSNGAVRALSARCGTGFARRMLLCGDRIEAAEAYHRGLVDLLVADGKAEVEAAALATTLARAAGAPMARARRELARLVSGPARPSS